MAICHSLSLMVLAAIASHFTVSATIAGMLKEANFTVFVDELIKNNMTDILDATGPITIFAPTDQALTTYMAGDMYKKMSTKPDFFKKVLRTHAIAGQRMTADKIQNDMTVRSMAGDRLRFNIYGEVTTVNSVPITMLPSSSSGNALIYTINSTITSDMGHHMVAVLRMHPSVFSIAVRAIQISGLLETFEEGGPYTFFVPTDDAFKANLTGQELEKFLYDPPRMKNVMLGHVIKGTYFLIGLKSSDHATLNGGSNKIVVKDKNVTVDGASVNTSASDMLAKNGVIHVINHLLSAS